VVSTVPLVLGVGERIAFVHDHFLRMGATGIVRNAIVKAVQPGISPNIER
jgi:hypothetical protein